MKAEKNVNLEKLLKQYPTVKAEQCSSCGNGWFFAMDNSLTCTTCYQITPKESHNE